MVSPLDDSEGEESDGLADDDASTPTVGQGETKQEVVHHRPAASRKTARRTQPQDPELRAVGGTLTSLRMHCALSLGSLVVMAVLAAWTYFEVRESNNIVLWLLVLFISIAGTFLFFLLMFYSKALRAIQRPVLVAGTGAARRASMHDSIGRRYQKYSDKFTHLLIVSCLMILVETISLYQILLGVIFGVRTDAVVCAAGIFSSFDSLTERGQAIYLLVIFDYFFGLFCFIMTTRYAYAMNVYYLELRSAFKRTAVATPAAVVGDVEVEVQDADDQEADYDMGQEEADTEMV